MATKTVNFENNPHGIIALEVDTTQWVIKSTCTHLPAIYNRACRLSKKGTRLEYRASDGYHEIPADIKSIV